MMSLRIRYGAVYSLMLCLLILTGCVSGVVDGSSANSKHVGLTDSSYAAADMLIQQSRMAVTSDTPLEVGVLTDLNNPNEITNFGNVITRQIGSRFVQLGYNVVSSPTGAVMAMPQNVAPAGGYAAGMGAVSQATIAGQYAVARNEVLVNLRIIETGTGRVMAAYDYSVPYTRDVRELTKTQAEKESFFNF